MAMNKARKLLHRDSSPILSFSSFGAKKSEERRRSEGVVVPSISPKSPRSPKSQRQQEPSLPKFYIKGINRVDAEEILQRQPVGTFLMRDRETANSPGCYTLSLRHKASLKHHKIDTHPSNNKIVIAGYERFQFDTLEQLTEFFIKSQKKDITLVPYDPDGFSTRMQSMSLEQHGYEEMDAPEDVAQNLDVYQDMDEDVHVPSHSSYQNVPSPESHRHSSHQNGEVPPPIPSRRDKLPGPSSYENLNRQQKSVPLPQKPQQKMSYENLSGKGAAPAPPPPGGPPIPPRVSHPHSSLSYENMEGKSPPRPGSYENMPERRSPTPQRRNYQNVADRPAHGPGYENYGSKPTGYENYFSKSSRPSTLAQPATPGHSYQNLPPKVAPRRSPNPVNYSAEQALPPRKPVPIRRVKTDTERDFNARRF